MEMMAAETENPTDRAGTDEARPNEHEETKDNDNNMLGITYKEQQQLQLLQQQYEVSLNALPNEILEFILSYLPPYNDLENCSLVCKRWNFVVKNLIHISRLNLHKGFLDFRLQWEIFTQQTAIDIENSAARLSSHYDATTSTSTATTTTSPQQIQTTSPTIPIIAGRFSHSAVRHGNAMYVFGGGSCSDTTFNDLWRFDLSAMRWERPLSMGSYPSPKGSASMACWGDQLILFGGWRYPSLYPPYQPWCLFDELHYYDLQSHRWTLHVSPQSPPPMAGHSASIHGDRMIVFGGYQISDGINSNSNETWCLDLPAHRWWQPRIAGNVKPPPRYGQFQLVLDDQHLLVVGGCGGPNAVYSDAWLLDMTRDTWQWRTIPVRNKKYGASHMWCNPACKVDSKLVVLGPTPNMPQDFQMMKQSRLPMGGNGGMPGMNRPAGGGGGGGVMGGVGGMMQNNRNNPLERPGRLMERPLYGGNARGGPGEPGMRAPLHQNRFDHMHRLRNINDPPPAAGNNHNNNNYGNNNNNNNNYFNNLQPRVGRVRDLHAPPQPQPQPQPPPPSPAAQEERNQNRPSTSASRLNGSPPTPSTSASASSRPSESDGGSPNGAGSSNPKDLEAAHRLQRNLALRCRDNEPLLPKRFDEMYEDPFRMAAFNVQNRPRSVSKDHNERIRRMEEKMNALRNSRRNALMHEQKSLKEPSPKRIKRNVLSLFVCDLSAALDATDPHVEWIENKNYGVIPGAPERLILSTMVAGNGELILFGGVHKETLTEISHQVSNTLHFLSAPRDIV